MKLDNGDLEESALLMSGVDRLHVRESALLMSGVDRLHVREGRSKSDADMIATDITEIVLHRCEASLC